MTINAKKVQTFYEKYFTHIQFEYRGRKYEVEYPNSHRVVCTAAWVQHKSAQERIDKEIESEKIERERPANPVDFNKIWAVLGWNE